MSETLSKRIQAAFPNAREPWLAMFTRTLVYVITAGVLAFPLAVPEGVFGAILGAVTGAILGLVLGASRVRTHVAVGLALGGGLLGLGLSEFVVGSESLADAIGPSIVMRLGDLLAFFSVAASVSTALRTLSFRTRSLASLEVAVIVLAFASLVVSHRNGAIHRPYELADPLLQRGLDPSTAILVIGALAAIVVGMLLLSERSLIRSIWHVAFIFLMLGFVLYFTHASGLPPPPPANDGLSLRDDQSQGGQGQGGQNNQPSGPDFQDNYDQSGAQTPVAVILLHDDYSPPSGVYYFRQDAFSQYNGRRLVSAHMDGVDDDVAPTFPSQSVNIESAPPAGQFRSTVETTVGLLADHPRPFGLESPITLFPATNPDTSRFRRVYRVRSASLTADEYSLLGRRAGSPLWTPEIIAHYTRGPEDPRYAALANEIVQGIREEYRDDPYARALAVTRWLGDHGIYSLQSRHAGASDPTADFLFGDRTGYCVHFAHATVYLLRSIGLPARVATGYLYAESSRQGGSAILLAGANSHAWPEVYVDGVGWVVVDVSPQQALDPPPGSPDEELQQLLAELLRGNRIIPDDGSEPPQPIQEVVANLRGFVTSGLGILVFALLALAYAIKVWRRLAPSFVSGPDLPRVTYRAALDKLLEGGVQREEGESREAFAERIRDRFGALTKLSRFTEAKTFGGALPRDLAAQTRAASEQLTRDLRARIPFWRRLLGLLDPTSWMRVR
jgi:transglutaminase-like putative cysteine protease